MCKVTMNSQIRKLKELKSMRDNLDAQIEDLETWIKSKMTQEDKYEFIEKSGKVSWKMTSSNRFDQKTFGQDHPDLLEAYRKVTESRRFLLT